MYIALGPFAWGKGDTPSEAAANCKPNIYWTCIKKEVREVVLSIYQVTHPDTVILDDGRFEYPAGHRPKLIDNTNFKVKRPR